MSRKGKKLKEREMPMDKRIEQLVSTLPIGLYCGRRVPCQLDYRHDASGYSPDQDAILISAKQIQKGLSTAKEKDFEKMVRTNFYHEVSHAILTPTDMIPTDIYNIFEDERIETLLKDYYYGVDFEGMKRHMTGYRDDYPITDSLSAFFALVRFRKGKKELVDEVDRIIKRFSTLSRDGYSSDYTSEIENLFRKVASLTDSKEDIEKYLNDLKKQGEKEKSESETIREVSADGSVEETDSESDTAKKSETIITREQLKEIMEGAVRNKLDEKFFTTLSMLFENFNKKNSKGGALQGYSGVLNPRLADRKDYRIFERSASIRGNNQYGTFHLNVFIDTSGSFGRNDDTVNSMIRALEKIEKKNRTFTFDIITMGAPSNEKVLPKDKRRIHSYGGNHLSRKIFDIFRKQQLPMTYNYNIILFDGDAYSNDTEIPFNVRLPNGEGFKAFAHNNCTIISDGSNHRYIEKYCPTTKTIYTNSYCAELYNNIIKIMQKALT